MEDTNGAEKARAKHLRVDSPGRSHKERSSGHITAFREEDIGIIGRSKSMNKLLTEFFIFMCTGVCMVCWCNLTQG